MKKFLFLGLILVGLTAAASAQQASGDNFRRHRITNGSNNDRLGRHEGYRMHKEMRQRMERRDRGNRFNRRFENKRFHNMRRHRNREMFRGRHGGRRRVI